MTIYACNACGMAVEPVCAKCHDPLINDVVTTETGEQIQVSKCPNNHGKIKSPQCCGQDMNCSEN